MARRRAWRAGSNVHIEANGDVAPCVLHESPFTPKNLIRDGFEAALQHVQHHSCGDCFLPYESVDK